MTRDELLMLQALPLDIKILKTKQRLRDAIDYFGVEHLFLAVSGGLDSTVLHYILKELEEEENLPHIPRVFSNTGNEYDGVLQNARSLCDVEVKPLMTPHEVWTKVGYPVGSKKIARMIHDLQNPTEKNAKSRNLYLNGIRSDGQKGSSYSKLAKRYYPFIEPDCPYKVSNKCCDILKKEPMKRYQKESGRYPIIATMSDEGGARAQSYLQTGCNAFKQGKSLPVGFWTKQDVLQYIVNNNIPIPVEYGEIVEVNGKLDTTLEKRTGCFICMFGAHLEKGENRFQRMKRLYPKRWNYAINVLKIGEVLDLYGVDYGREDND